MQFRICEFEATIELPIYFHEKLSNNFNNPPSPPFVFKFRFFTRVHPACYTFFLPAVEEARKCFRKMKEGIKALSRLGGADKSRERNGRGACEETVPER